MAIPKPDPALIARFRADLEALAGPHPGTLGVAVSGGPDSLGLLLLAGAAFPGAVRAATVDHRLRRESAAEAEYVAKICVRLGIPHAILTGDPVAGNVQAGARDLRYRLLAAWAAGEGVVRLLTAHHADDQAETLLMRLDRGAGVGGLSGIRAAATIAGAAIARPLLGWRRAELAEIVAAAGLTAVDDPSNADEKYDRTRLRRRLAETPWLDVEALARSAAALAEADAGLDWIVAQLWESRVRHASGEIRFDADDLPAELVRRLLVRILATLNADTAPRGAEIQRLAGTLAAGGQATLAGMQCRAAGQYWTFTPAPPRRRRS